MVSWARFETVKGRKRFYYYNTHFAHRREDEDARTRSAEVILSRFSKLPAREAFLLTGDFNTGPASAAYRLLTAAGMKDAWTAAPRRSGPEGTFHGFTGKPGAQRIDWILHRSRWRLREAQAIDWNQDGRYPSDHFPVLAVFELR
jgi:endonuclease/exonuclease/phosphatase family metal-dependent hydrolase